MSVNTQDIETYLADLGAALVSQGIQQPVRILMVGGAYMLTQIGNRQVTKDIDVLLEDIPDPSASPLYRPFQAAARAVATQHNLPTNWINDVIGDALRNYGPTPQGTLWRVYGPLEVYVPDAEYILALKILAGRAQDLLDAEAICQRLGVSTRAQAQQILDSYITDSQIQQVSGVDATLAALFP